MQFDHLVSPIAYSAPKHVHNAILSLGRTEDVRFSPSNQRLAVAALLKNKITVFDISVSASDSSKRIELSSATNISSAYLNSPHGIDFIDDDKIIVANRDGQVCIFELPSNGIESCELAPVAILKTDRIITPGSVAVIRNGDGPCEALICNNYANRVTKHLLDLREEDIPSKVLLEKWLSIPDGISLSTEQRWIAISNHATHVVFLYENKPSLNALCTPDGILRRIYYPHGLRFTSDGNFILVADASSACVNIYEKGATDWRGVRDPIGSIRVLNNEDFLRRKHNPEEVGPKGIDVHDAQKVLVTTCECQPLAFFDLAAILKGACGKCVPDPEERLTYHSYQLLAQQWLYKRKALEVSWYLHSPLQRLHSLLKDPNRIKRIKQAISRRWAGRAGPIPSP
jgi:hypothetical protein